MCSGSEDGTYSRLIDVCITQFWSSKEEDEGWRCTWVSKRRRSEISMPEWFTARSMIKSLCILPFIFAY